MLFDILRGFFVEETFVEIFCVSDLVIGKLVITGYDSGVISDAPSVLHIQIDGKGILGAGSIEILDPDLTHQITDGVHGKLGLAFLYKPFILDIPELVCGGGHFFTESGNGYGDTSLPVHEGKGIPVIGDIPRVRITAEHIIGYVSDGHVNYRL